MQNAKEEFWRQRISRSQIAKSIFGKCTLSGTLDRDDRKMRTPLQLVDLEDDLVTRRKKGDGHFVAQLLGSQSPFFLRLRARRTANQSYARLKARLLIAGITGVIHLVRSSSAYG